MGYYLQCPNKTGKAAQLILLHGAEPIECPKSFAEVPTDKALICVVENGPFDAAGFAYDAEEFAAFRHTDFVEPQRPRSWLLMDRAMVEALVGFRAGFES